ncbi:MAG TPA: hypothetical protein PLB89_05155 [Flavobacteriales bacterium]|nr:hypothetical protein [Flavobacteriales bacterium]
MELTEHNLLMRREKLAWYLKLDKKLQLLADGTLRLEDYQQDVNKVITGLQAEVVEAELGMGDVRTVHTVREVVAKMEPADAVLITLKYLQGYNYAAVALKLSISEEKARELLFGARSRMLDLMRATA